MHRPLKPGDLLLTRSRTGMAGRLIRFGALLTGQVEAWNHVCAFHHIDPAGTPWGIEGRPGGVGWVDIRHYIKDPHTLTNVGQPKTDEQRQIVTSGAEGLLGVAYDWASIGLDAVAATRINLAWSHNGGDGPPAHVVCSSLADWLYNHAGLTSPSKMPWQLTTPADWAELIMQSHWQENA